MGEGRQDRLHLGLDPELPEASPVSAVWKVWAWHKPCRLQRPSNANVWNKGWILRAMWPREL